MSYVHEPNKVITYIISGKYAQIIYDILKRQDAGRGDDIGDIMIREFDGTYYNFDPEVIANTDGEVSRLGERLEEFSMKDDGNLEIVLEFYDVGKEFPYFLLWKFPNIEIKMYAVSKNDAWWWNCTETDVTTNDPEGAKSMGIDAEGYYTNLVSTFEKELPKNIRNEQGEWQVRTEWDDEGNETWEPLQEYYKYHFNVVKLERPSEAPVPQSFVNKPIPSPSVSKMDQDDKVDETQNFDLPF